MGALLTILALTVRLVWVLVVPTRPVGDFAMYVESARHLVEHRALPTEFIYMPGYVYLVAAIDALGGGLTAIKMIGVVSGGVATASVYGTTRAVFGGGAAVLAGLLCALWPAGIAVSSVTGTDLPAAALIALAVYFLCSRAAERPLGAPVLFGLTLGLASYVRAVALPLTALGALHFRARGAEWLHVVTRTVVACVVAFLVLLPWGLRNRRLYGELFLTDSHGGHTALVGANPNSEGTYSRSLNRQFSETTGYSLFAPPFRASDRAAYALAEQWTRVQPKYALGLLAAKADRLLGAERALLYWPLYRASVLPPGNWFEAHRAAIERIVDGFWYFLVAAMVVGLTFAASRRNWPALTLLPMPLGLAALYTLFFAEVRYQLAVVVLLLPFAGAGVAWLLGAAHDVVKSARSRGRLCAEAVVAAALIVLVFRGWPRLMAKGASLRERYRWAVCVCQVEGAKRLCDFRATLPPPGTSASPVRGVWDGFGLRLVQPKVAAAADLELPAGSYRISMQIDGNDAPPPEGGATVELGAGASSLAKASWPEAGTPITLRGTVAHPGGNLPLALRINSGNWSGTDGSATLWISAIEVEPDRP